jgi:hypothetical protein
MIAGEVGEHRVSKRAREWEGVGNAAAGSSKGGRRNVSEKKKGAKNRKRRGRRRAYRSL